MARSGIARGAGERVVWITGFAVFGLNEAVTTSDIERAVGLAGAVTADIGVFAVVAFFAAEVIDEAVAAERRDVGTAEAAAAVGAVVDAIVTDFAQGGGDDAVATFWDHAIFGAHVFV